MCVDKETGIENSRLLSSILDLISVPIFVLNAQGKIIYWNRSMAEISDMPAEAIIGTKRYTELLGVPLQNEIRALLRQETEVVVGEEILSPRIYGERTVNICVQAIKVDDGPPEGAVATLEDTTDLRAAQDRASDFQETSNRDALTGLFNSRLFFETIKRDTARADREKRPLSLILMDLDNFKQINDTFGHPKGDIVLQRFADCIQRNVRSSEIAFRYGGEEFAVILFDASIDGAVKVAERVRKSLMREEFYFITGEHPVRVTVSLGVAEYKAGEGHKGFVERVDQLLYKAKSVGRNRTVYY